MLKTGKQIEDLLIVVVRRTSSSWHSLSMNTEILKSSLGNVVGSFLAVALFVFTTFVIRDAGHFTASVGTFLSIAIPFLAGFLGGYGGYLAGRTDSAGETTEVRDLRISERRWHLRKSLTFGVIAAWAVPAFFELMSIGADTTSILRDVLVGDVRNTLIYFSFSVLAALSGQRFITKVSSKLLGSQVQKMEKQVASLKEDLVQIQKNAPSAKAQLSESARKVLTILEQSKSEGSEAEELSVEGLLSTTETNSALDELITKQLIKKDEVDEAPVFHISTSGLAALEGSNSNLTGGNMAEVKVKVTYADDNDWLALYVKPTEDEALACEPSECETLDGWTRVELIGKKEATLSLEPGKYMHRYEAGNTKDNEISVKLSQGDDVILPLTITLGSEGTAFGCGVFRVWS